MRCNFQYVLICNRTFTCKNVEVTVLYWMTGPEVIKLFSCLTEHEILNAHKDKISRNSAFWAQTSLECYFPAHKCYNANNCWHFNIYEQEKFHAQLS